MLSAKRPQRTIAREAEVAGVGFLSGAVVRTRFRPAPADHGIVFERSDLPGRPTVPALVAHVVPRQRRTSLQRGEAVVEMVEHVLAALAGLKIDNCAVSLDAAETPGCDGSSLAFVEAIAGAGAVEQARPRPVLTIDRPVTVREGGASLTASPGPGPDGRLIVSYNLDYARTPIGRQSLFLEITAEAFRDELAASRTFLLEDEAVALHRAGIGRHASGKDLLVFRPDGSLIDNALRFADECVRHKMLDVVGDLALLGCDLEGHVMAHRSGHHLNAELVRRLLALADEASPPAEEDGGDAPDTLPMAPALDIGGVMAILPHRYPFLLVDRVLEVEPGRRVVALKNVSCNEPFFQGHWPGRPIMPGVLIVEALAQAGGLLIAHRFDPRSHAALIAGIDEVRVRRPVTPGDQLILEVTSLKARARLADVQGVARVGDEVVAEARIRFVIVPAGGEAAA